MSDEAVEWRVRAGYLHRVFRGAYAVGHRAIGRRGWMLAAVLACGDGAVITHGSAAELLGLWDKRQALVDITPPRRTGRAIDGVRWHGVRRLEPDEVATVDGIPCGNPSRTLIDLAGHFGDRSLRRFVERAAVLRVLDVAEIDRILARGRRRGTPRLRAILDSWRGEDEVMPRLRSLLEARLRTALVDAGVPLPCFNQTLEVDGMRIEVDTVWERQKLVVEADGERFHATPGAFQLDRRRDQALAASGYRHLRITWRQIEDESHAVAERIRRALASAEGA